MKKEIEGTVSSISQLQQKLDQAERFSELTTGLLRFNLLGWVSLFTVANPFAVAAGLTASTLLFANQDARNIRRVNQLSEELGIMEAGDFAPLIYPHLLTS